MPPAQSRRRWTIPGGVGRTAMSSRASSSETAGPSGLRRYAVRLESLAVLAILIVALALLSPYFLSVSNFLNILLATSVIGVLAFGATFVIAAAGLERSPGSGLGLLGRPR